MRVNVRVFASLRDAAGRSEVPLELPASATAEEGWRGRAGEFPGRAPRRASLAVAVNRRGAGFETALQEGDEHVFNPPVSGG